MHIEKLIKIVHFLARNNSSVKELYSKRIKFLSDEIIEYRTPFRPNIEIYFHDEQLRVYYERSRFSSWQVDIFMMNGGDFHHDRSRFSS